MFSVRRADLGLLLNRRNMWTLNWVTCWQIYISMPLYTTAVLTYVSLTASVLQQNVVWQASHRRMLQ